MTQPRVLVLQHAPWERPGRILQALDDVDMPTTVDSILDEKKPKLPEFNELAGLVLMGGPMNALSDNHPGLAAEAKLARACVMAGKPVLGVCLGHQILATALGGKLKQSKTREIGFAPITKEGTHEYFPMFQTEQAVLNWHTDTVSLPPHAQLLASSKGTKNQAFRLGSALGLQFHLEVTPSLLEEWLRTDEVAAGLKKAEIHAIRSDFDLNNASIKVLADAVFSGFAARCLSYARALQGA